jgi:hypothetical protein
MIKAMNSKTFENLRDGMMDGMGTAWKASKQASKRLQFRSPVIYEKPSGWAGGWISIGILSAAALALGAWMYFRKRKQVADRYTMGEGPGANWEADRVPVGEQMPNPAH